MDAAPRTAVGHAQSAAPQTAHRLALLVAAPTGSDLQRAASWLRDAGRVNGCQVTIATCDADFMLPGATVIRSAPGTSLFALWGVAVASAQARHVAFLDARCHPAAGWLDEAIAGACADWPVFFGPVVLGPDADRHQAIQYVLEYAQFASPVRHDLEEVPGNNLVMRRELITAGALRGGEFHKVFLIAELRRRGIEPRYLDRLRVIHAKRYRAPHYLCRRYAHGRSYAARRVEGQGGWTRLVRAGSTVLVPPIRLVRVVRSVRGKPDLRKALLRNAAFAFASETAWSVGECLGYAVGGSHDARWMD